MTDSLVLDKLKEISASTSEYVVNDTEISERAQSTFRAFCDLALAGYLKRTPYAEEVLDLLVKHRAKIVNDHVALRTFTDRQGTHGLEVLEKIFLSFGYRKEENIQIPSLLLDCYWYEPPSETNWPKVFISEQQTNKLPDRARNIVYKTIGTYYSSAPLKHLGLDDPENADPHILYSVLEQPPWNPSFEDYCTLQELSEEFPEMKNALQYAAWTLVHGHRWNHYTILLNSLSVPGLKKLEDLNEFLKKNGFPLNSSGGKEVQGDAKRFLKQSSTVANEVNHEFMDGTVHSVPGSFVEFIERFYCKGQPFRGFLANNAKGIFTSTNAVR